MPVGVSNTVANSFLSGGGIGACADSVDFRNPVAAGVFALRLTFDDTMLANGGITKAMASNLDSFFGTSGLVAAGSKATLFGNGFGDEFGL